MSRTKFAITILVFGALLIVVFVLLVKLSENLVLVDFTYTFYWSGKYALRGDNVYASDYSRPLSTTQYPPYNPIWIPYVSVPFSVLPLNIATAIRFLLDLLAIPFLAYLSGRWAGVKLTWHVGLLAIAPWLSIMLYAGQWAGLVFLGVFLCFWGLKRAKGTVSAVGIWLLAINPNFTLLLMLTTLIYAYRNRMLTRVIGVLALLTVIFSLAQPTWVLDLLNLYLKRVSNFQSADSILLLPGWPWSQITLLGASVLFMLAYANKSLSNQPPQWLWAALVCVGLISALHEYTYDWIILMLPLAWLLRARFGVAIIIALYLYPFLWVLLSTMQIPLLSPTIIPSVILISVLGLQVLDMRQASLA